MMQTQTIIQQNQSIKQSIEQSHEGLFYDLMACLDRGVLETDPDDWGRLMSRSLERFYQLYGVEQSEYRSRKLRKSLRSLLFDLRNLSLLGRPKLNVYGSVVFFSTQGDFGKISFSHDFISRFIVGVYPLPYLPLGWLTIMRESGAIDSDTHGIPIQTNFQPNPNLYRRIIDWGYDLSERISDRRWRLKYLYRPSRYAFRARTAAHNSVQANLSMITRRIYQRRDLLKCDGVIPRFLINAFFRSFSDSDSDSDSQLADDQLLVGLTLKQRVRIQTSQALNYHKLEQYEEIYRPLVPNPAYRSQKPSYMFDRLAMMMRYLSLLDMELEIRSDDQQWFSFKHWQRQLVFTAKLTQWFMRRIEKAKKTKPEAVDE